MAPDDQPFRRGVARQTGELSVGAATWLVGLVLAALPPAWWQGRVPGGTLHAARAAAVSSILQFVLGVAAFFGGMILWLKGLSADIAATARAAGATDDGLREAMVGHMSLALSPILPFIYACTTWNGFATTLVVLGGLIRAVHVGVTREGMPDPTLAVVEAVRARLTRRARAAHRERTKGEPTPDRLLAGDGSRGFDMRLVSRDDHAWREGADVFIDGRPWRLIGRREVKDAEGRLRLQYDFRRLAGAEAARGRNAYQPTVPPLREGEPTG